MKLVIFLDIDGVLNEVYEDSPRYQEFLETIRGRTQIQEGIGRAWEEDAPAEEVKKLEKKLWKLNGKIDRIVNEIEDRPILSPKAVQRLKEICDATGAVVVLNGTQSRPLWDKEYPWHYGYTGYKTNTGKRIMNVFKEYGIPVEGYAYDIRANFRDGKVPPALKYMYDRPDIDGCIFIEDDDFALEDWANKNQLKKFMKFRYGIEDKRMSELIDSLSDINMVDTRDMLDEPCIGVKGLSEAKKDETIEKLTVIKQIVQQEQDELEL